MALTLNESSLLKITFRILQLQFAFAHFALNVFQRKRILDKRWFINSKSPCIFLYLLSVKANIFHITNERT